MIKAGPFQKEIARAREAQLVDYQRVASLKFQILEMLYADFRARHDGRKSEQELAFREFIQADQDEVTSYAAYAALQESFSRKDPSIWGWVLWPTDYQGITPDLIRLVRKEHEDRIRFYQFVEWLAHMQLTSVVLELSNSVRIILYEKWVSISLHTVNEKMLYHTICYKEHRFFPLKNTVLSGL